nr:fused MFS/spermidine synthase [Streptomyces aidingensis]
MPRSGAGRVPVTEPVDRGTARLLPDVDRPGGWLLTVDDAPQSYVDLDAPDHLEFEYARRIGHALDLAAPPGRPLDLLHLGGGGLTLPRYAAHTRPGSRQTVVEADAALAALVERRLPLPLGSGVTVRTADARAALRTVPAAGADVLIADVFAGTRTPASLTTLGFARDAARALRPGGWYLANLADGAPFAFLRGQLAALASVFAGVCLLAEPAVLRGRRFGNAVLLAADAGLPVAELARRCAADPFPARVVHGAGLAELIGDAEPVADENAARPSPKPPPGAFSVG